MHPHLLKSLAKQRHKEFLFEAENRYLSYEAEQKQLEAVSQKSGGSTMLLKLLQAIGDLLIATGTTIKNYTSQQLARDKQDITI